MLTFSPEPSDIHIADADLQHHLKYIGCSGQGQSQLSPSQAEHAPVTPSPIDVVQLGVEPLEYLQQFRRDSYWYLAIQEFLAEHSSVSRVS